MPQILNQQGDFCEAENCLVGHLRTAEVIQLKAQEVLACWLGSCDLGTVYGSERKALQLAFSSNTMNILLKYDN